ncbi:Hsp70 family protein [Cryptosporangium sp. NPDC048952]|uniref:Hsp70 family protein n=1 Tax=Cryptosporangium sp. NPDC048952 TaxID=3363961 RepID=UPI003715CBEB
MPLLAVDHSLAVDYGTSNTVAMVGWPDGRIRPLLFDGSPLLPSGVCLEPDGQLLAGRAAERAGRVSPQSYEPNPKRRIDDLDLLLGDRGVPVVTMIAATLNRVWQEVSRTLPEPPGRIVVTCPVTWGPARRSVLLDAARQAGLPDVTLLAEPVAAATYYTTVLDGHLPADGCLVVYDLGAGTFDVSVVRRGGEPLSYGGLDTFGSVDLDALVVSIVSEVVPPSEWEPLRAPRTLAEQRAFRALWRDASETKEALSSQSSAVLVVPLVERDVVIGREQFERLARPRLAETIDVTVQCMRAARVPASQVSGVFLVGGGSRTPLIGTLLHRATGIAPTVLDQPELVVAEGALHFLLTEPSPARELPLAPPPIDPGPSPDPPSYTPDAAPPPEPHRYPEVDRYRHPPGAAEPPHVPEPEPGPFLASALPPETFGARASGLALGGLVLALVGFLAFGVSVPVILQTLSYGARYVPLTWVALSAGSAPSLLLITAGFYRIGRLRRAARLRVDDLGLHVLPGDRGAERRWRALGWTLPSPLLILAALIFQYAWHDRANSVSALALLSGVAALLTGMVIGARSILPPSREDVLAWRQIRAVTLARTGPLRRRVLVVTSTDASAKPRKLDVRGFPARRLAAALERHGDGRYESVRVDRHLPEQRPADDPVQDVQRQQ